MAKMKCVKRYTGVYSKESAKRKHKGKPDRCYYFVWSDKTPEGKKRNNWVKVGWASEGYGAKVASEERGRHIQRVRHGELSPEGKREEITFGEAFDIFYNDHAIQNKKTYANDLSIYNNHLEHRFANRKLSTITRHDFDKIKQELLPPTSRTERDRLTKLHKGNPPWRSESTVRNVFMLASAVFNKMIDWPERSGYRGTNPVEKVTKPKPSRRRERFMSRQEADFLLARLKKSSLQTYQISLLSLETGMRMGEVFNLKWEDINWGNRMINLPEAKGGKDQKVYLPERAYKMLRDMANRRPSGFVFLNTKGEQVRELSNTFDRVVDKLGFNKGMKSTVDKVTPHTLRHTYASWLAQSGKLDVYELKEIMRHKEISTTMRYVHLIPDHGGRKAAQVISSLFPDREIRSFEDMVNMTPEEAKQAWEQLDQDFNEYYANDPVDS